MKPNYQHFRIDESLDDRITVWIDVQSRSVNALSEPVFDELLQIIDAQTPLAQHLPLVFRSAKRGSFVVGADLRRILSITTDAEIQQFLLQGQVVFERLASFAGTTVAVMHGACLGGGLELALACKFRIGVDSAKSEFGMPESKLGLMPGWGGTQRLLAKLGVCEGLTMLLTGNSIEVRRAYELQLIDAIVQESTLEEEVTAFLRHLTELRSDDTTGRKTRKSDRAADQLELAEFDLAHFGILSAAQEAIYQAASIGIQQSIDAGCKAERELFYPLLMSAEAQENLRKFVNRTKPSS
jgi:enoyl-CoA hydratase/carnithine racemase